MRKAWTRIIATFFGVGCIPLVPATWASAIATVLAWYLGEPLIYPVLAVFTISGFWACHAAKEVFESDDPKPFVMDEVCGMMLGVLWLPRNAYLYLAAFILFRILDAWKPWPISKIDESHRPSCILWDDIAAGVLTNVILQIAVRTFARF